MQQIHKRFHNANRWAEPWYRNLTPSQKLFWEYINDNCSNIGIWDIDLDMACFHIGIESIDLDRFLEKINADSVRVKLLNEATPKRLFLCQFVKSQYCPRKPLDPARNSAHRSYIRLMREHELFDWFVKNQPGVMKKAILWNGLNGDSESPPSPLGVPSESSKEKEMESEKAKAQEEELDQAPEMEKPPLPNVEEIQTFPDKDSHPNAPRAQHNTPKNTPNSGPSSRQELAENVLGYYKFKCGYTPENLQLDVDSFAELIRYLQTRGSEKPQAKILTRIEKLSTDLNGSEPPTPAEFVMNIMEQIENEI